MLNFGKSLLCSEHGCSLFSSLSTNLMAKHEPQNLQQWQTCRFNKMGAEFLYLNYFGQMLNVKFKEITNANDQYNKPVLLALARLLIKAHLVFILRQNLWSYFLVCLRLVSRLKHKAQTILTTINIHDWNNGWTWLGLLRAEWRFV